MSTTAEIREPAPTGLSSGAGPWNVRARPPASSMTVVLRHLEQYGRGYW